MSLDGNTIGRRIDDLAPSGDEARDMIIYLAAAVATLAPDDVAQDVVDNAFGLINNYRRDAAAVPRFVAGPDASAAPDVLAVWSVVDTDDGTIAWLGSAPVADPLLVDRLRERAEQTAERFNKK